MASAGGRVFQAEETIGASFWDAERSLLGLECNDQEAAMDGVRGLFWDQWGVVEMFQMS